MNLQVRIFTLIIFLSFACTQILKAQEGATKPSPAQITFFYPIGTHGIASDSIPYHFSLNMLWGFTGGIKGAELGGLFNKTNGTVTGAQFGGLGNFVAGNVTGGQFAGLINAASSFKGIQMGGLINKVEDKEGSSLEETPRNIGVQAAGLYNLQANSMKGVQIGLININREHIQGAQIAGLLNKTKTISGVQFGLINIADTVKKGVPIGLINIVKHGSYSAIEVEYNESFHANISYKLGVKRFYSIITVAFKEQNGKEFWAPGYGFGTYFPVANNTGINIDAISYHINEGEWWTNEENRLNKLKINCSFQLAPRLSLFGGFSVNVLVSGMKDEEGSPQGSDFKTPNSFYDKVNTNTHITIYPGLNAGIRF